MRGAKGHSHLFVVPGALILVPHQHRDWSAQRGVIDQPAEHVNPIGFLARGEAAQRSTRVELWAYGRRNPFRPLVGLDIWSLPGITERRINLRWGLRDAVARWIGHPWRPAGMKRPADD